MSAPHLIESMHAIANFWLTEYSGYSPITWTTVSTSMTLEFAITSLSPPSRLSLPSPSKHVDYFASHPKATNYLRYRTPGLSKWPSTSNTRTTAATNGFTVKSVHFYSSRLP